MERLAPDVPLDMLDLGARVVNVLRRADIRHLGELVLLREAAFYKLRGARRWTGRPCMRRSTAPASI